MMKACRNLHIHFSVAWLACLFATLLKSTAEGFDVSSRYIMNTPPRPRQRASSTRRRTRLSDNLNTDDFAEYSRNEETDETQSITREFYDELKQRQSYQTPLESIDDEDTREQSKVSTNYFKSIALSLTDQFVLPELSILSELLASPSPSETSAGLFSGTGGTIYSSGRSVHAEIEILESALKINHTDDNGVWGKALSLFNVNDAEELEKLKLILVSLIILSVVYITMESSEEMTLVLDQAATSAEHAFDLLVNTFSKEYHHFPSLMVNVREREYMLPGWSEKQLRLALPLLSQ